MMHDARLPYIVDVVISTFTSFLYTYLLLSYQFFMNKFNFFIFYILFFIIMPNKQSK